MLIYYKADHIEIAIPILVGDIRMPHEIKRFYSYESIPQGIRDQLSWDQKEMMIYFFFDLEDDK